VGSDAVPPTNGLQDITDIPCAVLLESGEYSKALNFDIEGITQS
jgi:hypothetical protein